MLGRIRAHVRSNVVGYIALFVALGGTAYAGATITGADIQDGSLTTADYKNNNIGSGDVRNFNLNDEDISQGTFVDFAADVGTVNAHQCHEAQISGINAQGDHLLLTPSVADSDPFLEYRIEYSTSQEAATLVTCNRTDVNQPDGTTHFNLLVIDAQ